MKRWLLLPIFVLAGVAAQAEMFRWVDADGKVHYSDQPPPANVKQVEKKKVSGGKPSEAPLPYALQQAVKNFPVTLYSSTCGEGCARASALLSKRGVPYTELDATDAKTQSELKTLTGGQIVVPVIKIGREVVKGFEEGAWNRSLDAAGYPKTALIAPRAPGRPANPAPAAAAPDTSKSPSDEAR